MQAAPTARLSVRREILLVFQSRLSGKGIFLFQWHSLSDMTAT